MQGIVGAEADTIEVHDVPPPLSIAAEILFSSLYQREKVKTPTWESVRKFNDTESYAIKNRYRYFYHCWKSVVSISHCTRENREWSGSNFDKALQPSSTAKNSRYIFSFFFFFSCGNSSLRGEIAL